MTIRKIVKFGKYLLIFVVLLLLATPFLIKQFMGEDTSNIATGLAKQMVGFSSQGNIPSPNFQANSNKIQLDKNIYPFREIGKSLGEEAKGNNIVTFRGMTVFDANNDGKLDLYFTHSGRPIPKKNDDENILAINTLVDAKPNVLYINTGNDDHGNPIFKTVPDLIDKSGNKQFVREELLIENKYKPRNSTDESPFDPGRISTGAMSADFNADGKIDLLVLDHHFGMPFSKDFGFRVYPPGQNIGRPQKGIKHIKTFLPPYLAGDLKDGHNQTVNFSGKEEPEGRNSLFLNLGDNDNDGLPEWEDATNSTGMHTTNWASASATVADIDRDGDIDIYISNFLDPDFWGFGIEKFAGNPNELWINQLAETGKLSFIEKAEEFGVSTIHDQKNFPSSVWNKTTKKLVRNSNLNYKGQQMGKEADHSWVAQFVDYNNDGWPDLFLANDTGNRLRVWTNQKGKKFKVEEQFHHPYWNGSWMGVASGDLNNDGQIEVMIANFGTQALTMRNTAIFAEAQHDMNIAALTILNTLENKASLHHPIFTYDKKNGLTDIANKVRLEHSLYLPPDIVTKENMAPEAYHLYDELNIKNSITSLEFSWNQAIFDIDNDGDLDIYSAGSLARGNDDFLGEFTSSPGRLLINESTKDQFKFTDKTIEYQVLDISDMEYDTNPPRRKSPGTNWHKRDYIYLQDRDAYSEMGVDASRKSRIYDIFRMHENATGTIWADLNSDGFNDFIVLHGAGNNSNLSTARNLNLRIVGKVLAVPPPNKIIKAPTNFEEGPTFVYINGGSPKSITPPNYVQIILQDTTNYNLFGVGAKVIANDRIFVQHVIGGESFSSSHKPIHIGLGTESLEKLIITWGSGVNKPQTVRFNKPISNELITIYRANYDIIY